MGLYIGQFTTQAAQTLYGSLLEFEFYNTKMHENKQNTVLLTIFEIICNKMTQLEFVLRFTVLSLLEPFGSRFIEFNISNCTYNKQNRSVTIQHPV